MSAGGATGFCTCAVLLVSSWGEGTENSEERSFEKHPFPSPCCQPPPNANPLLSAPTGIRIATLLPVQGSTLRSCAHGCFAPSVFCQKHTQCPEVSWLISTADTESVAGTCFLHPPSLLDRLILMSSVFIDTGIRA